MNKLTILCPGGAPSQTGDAVKKRYPNASITDCGKIPEVPPQLETNIGPYVIPIWNSHQGEVKAADYVWNHIEQAKITITDAWAKRIEFWFVKRVGSGTTHRKIGSVVVAETQCSIFLEKQSSNLAPCALTTVAFDDYRKGAEWDGVLVAPGQGENEPEYEVASKETANPNNFTSFVRFVPTRAFTPDTEATKSWFTGVTMRSFGASLGDSEQSFFEQMLTDVTDLSNMPKLLFVFKRTAKIGLLFEGMRLHAGDLLDVEQLESGDISVYEDAGAAEKLYSDELHRLSSEEFPLLIQEDFILHCGVDTCLFACPPLGIFTHGFQVEIVEPVVRFLINKVFQLWDDGVTCTAEQIAFFQRHEVNWREQGSDFIKFTTIT